MVEEVAKSYKPGELKEQVLKVTTPEGETKTYSLSEAMAMGYNPSNLSGERKLYSYTDDSGNRKYTTKITDLPSSITLDEKTGNIKITAPKSVTDLPEFKQVFDEETFKSYSLAYKLNPDYKVKVQEYNAETGQQEEKELTIPEWVKNRDKAIKLFMEDLSLAEEQRSRYAAEYGDKAYNMTPTHIMMTQQYDKYTYLPEILKSASSFGDDPNKGNPFAQIWAKVAEDGRISAEDLKEIFNRDNFGRSELAGVMATINGALEASDWGKEYYTDADGNEVYNRNSAKEAAKLIAFKNFLLSHHPDGNWWQEMGGNLETLSYNAMYGMTRVVSNIANDMEGFFSNGSSKNVQNYIKDMDTTMDFYNETQGMTSEATQTLAFLGMIGGTLAASWATGKVAGAAISGVGKLGSAALGKALMSAAGVEEGMSQAEALAKVISNADNITKGANFAVKMATTAEKTALATNTYRSFMKSHVALNFATKFLLDTIHDALLYDSTTLRDALESADGDTRTYWLGQLADNAKWWAGMSFAKGMMKFSGKTALGKAINVRSTRLINKVAAKIGKTNAKIKDKFNGGDLIRKLEAQIEDAKSNNKPKAAKRLATKKQVAEWNIKLREARAELGDLKLEWNGIKLTEESADKYRAAMTKIKGYEISIDDYRRSVEWQRQYMVGTQEDPATGKKTFINPFLGNANLRATEAYLELGDLAKKYKLAVDKDRMISQDMINYWIGRYRESLAISFMDFDTVKGAEARDALPILQKNVEDAASRLPEEITTKIDTIVKDKIYQKYYLEQNEYGMAHGLLNRAKIEGLHTAKPWKENGYMPIVVLMEDNGVRVTNIDGLIGAKIEADMDDIHFKVTEGQNYEDPELIRQSRLDEMAQLEVNSRMFKAYNGFDSTAANIIKISGEETEYARILKSSRGYLESQVEKNAKAFAENLNVTPTGTPRRKPIKNVTVPESDRVTIVASMSPEQVNGFLVDRHVLAEGETIVGNVTAENYAKWYKDQSSSVKKYLAQQYDTYDVDAKKVGDAGSYQYFERASKEGGVDFENGLERASLVGHKEFARSPLMNEARHNLDMGREAFYQGVVIADIKAKLRNVKKVDTTELVDNLVPAVRELTDDYVNAVLSDEGAMAAIKTLSESTDASEQFARYIALRRLSESGMDKAYKALDNKLRPELKKIKDISANDVDNIMKRADELLDYTVETELDDLSLVVKTTNPELVETKDIYQKADDLNKEIQESTPGRAYGETTVMYLDDQGRQVFAEVDPAFASLYNYRYKMDKTEASIMAKINAQTARLFRYGTTTVNLKSFGNQLFRDFGNALYVGGSWQTIKAYRNNLVDVFGENIVDQIGRFDPTGYEMKQVEKIAEINGQTVEEAAISREFMRGAAISPTTTERTLYKDFAKEAYGADSNGRLKTMQKKFQKFVDDHNLNPEDWLNGKRENYLRNRVYAHSFNDALEQGYNLEQARVYAEFAMNNATTNFSRQLYHLQAIADSTPYFRAAINGTKSFWRMWSLDPVGISGRITGGLIIPVMYLTGASLGSEENRKVYENLPEYQKQDSLIFVINGSVVSAPLPQELAPIVAPFRQFVEQLYGTNKNDFWELMMNDVLGFFPYDLQGFSAIDMDAMIQDPTIFDRVSRGVARVFSQMAPIPVKTTYMLASGVDPYSGKSLRNPEYSYWNEETQSVETLDYNQNSFAKVIASIPGIKDWVTPELAEKVVSGVVGTTGSNLLGDVTALFTNGGGAMLEEAMGNIGESISAPFTVPQYDLTNAIWKRAVRELTAEKDYILHSADMDTINKKLAQEKDPEKRKGLLSERQNLVNEFQNKVGETVKRLSSEYQGTFDNKKFAAVIQLLNFNTDPVYQTASQYASDLATNLYYEGRDAAIQTMRDLGIDGVHDTSIFGYLTEDKNGNVVVRYNSPIAIMDMDATWGNQKDYHLANIKALVSRDNLWDKKDAIDSQIDAIYAKGKLSDADYDAIDAIYVNWDAEVMKTLAPYINELTPEATINNRDVMQYLSGLIKVPGEFKKDKYGRYVTNSKLGGLGSANDAYIKNYIRYIFGINDTSYESGINFSDRTKYDKENKRWTK